MEFNAIVDIYESYLATPIHSLYMRTSLKRLLVTCGVSWITWNLVKWLYHNRRNKLILIKKQNNLNSNIESIRNNLTNLSKPVDELLSLVEKDLDEVCQLIQKNDITPDDLLHAYQIKALNLWDSGNSGIAEFIKEAETFVKNLKTISNEDQSPRSPLYGVPISIKESFSVSGYDACIGLIKRCNQPMKKDCVVIKVLKNAGAIPFVTTCSTQLARSLDGYNAIYGQVKNPFGVNRTPGGSSSGEGVLLAQHGSPVGIGSDIGGSIRIPAAFCGLASLKPTTNRLSKLGMATTAEHSVLGLEACLGPMGRKTEDLVRVMRTLLCEDMFKLDPYVIPMPFNEDLYKGVKNRGLVIGICRTFPNLNIVQVTSVCQTSVNRAAGALEKAGHNIVSFAVPHPLKAHHLYVRSVFADGGLEFRERLTGEPISPQLRLVNIVTRFPLLLKKILVTLGKIFLGKEVVPIDLLHGVNNARAAIDLLSGVKEYRTEFANAWKAAGPLDALICPVSVYPAPPINTSALFVFPSLIYTSLFNLLDYPAGTVPVGFVDKFNVKEAARTAHNLYFDGELYMSKIYKLLQGSDKLPLAVQVIAKPYHEEIVLRVMRDIENNINQIIS